jgi:DUF1365 family protein
MNSSIYEGIITHKRLTPAQNKFKYKLFLVYLDLAEIETVFKGRLLWSANRASLCRFRRSDHFGNQEFPLDQTVRDKVEKELGRRPNGPIRMLTHLRYFGYYFNPISIYYCFDETGSRPDVVVGEVSNTPWGEKHVYVLPVDDGFGGSGVSKNRLMKFSNKKCFHVSPFMKMDLEYYWQMTVPTEDLSVQIEVNNPKETMLDVKLELQRKAINGLNLAHLMLKYPWMTGQVIGMIYYQALKLWLKKVPYVPPPKKSEMV